MSARSPLFLFGLMTLNLTSAKAGATAFSQEPFLVPHGVSGNGTALLLAPSAGSPMNVLDWPAGTPVRGIASIEASKVPLFDGLSEAVLGAGHFRYDDQTRLFAMTGIIGTDDIPLRPLLTGSHAERLNRPELRPGDCEACGTLNDRVYLGALNAQRSFTGQLPRTGIGSQPVPITLWGGATAKYFWEELEGGDYEAQGLNLDLGLRLEVALGYDPVSRSSQRDLVVHFSGFEVLPASQRSEIDGYVKEEAAEPRWHLGLSWREVWPGWHSVTTVGITQQSEGWHWPGPAAEWGLADAVFLRAGFDGQAWGAGLSLRWKMLTLHYAMQQHPLGMTWYQIAIQAEWLDWGSSPGDT